MCVCVCWCVCRCVCMCVCVCVVCVSCVCVCVSCVCVCVCEREFGTNQEKNKQQPIVKCFTIQGATTASLNLILTLLPDILHDQPLKRRLNHPLWCINDQYCLGEVANSYLQSEHHIYAPFNVMNHTMLCPTNRLMRGIKRGLTKRGCLYFGI